MVSPFRLPLWTSTLHPFGFEAASVVPLPLIGNERVGPAPPTLIPPEIALCVEVVLFWQLTEKPELPFGIAAV
jgi:hypothetical protein